MTAYTFYIDSIVRGYHEYQSIWDNPLEDRELLCEWETRSSHDLQAVTIKKMVDGALQAVGWVYQGKYLKFVGYH